MRRAIRCWLNSYIDAVAGTAKKPTAQQVAKYIADHPQAFGERRIYHFQRLILPTDRYSDNMQPMFDKKPQVQSFDPLVDYLKGQGISYKLADVQLPSTDFPEQIQKRLEQFGVGDNVVVRGPQSIIILKIKGWTAMAVQDADAQRVAVAAIQQEELAQRTAALRKQVIHDAKITFSGAFAGMNADQPGPSVPAAKVSSAPATATPHEAGVTGAAAVADGVALMNAPDMSLPEGVMPAPPSGTSTNPEEGTVQ